MSDAPTGPGSWQGSDGRWYPPAPAAYGAVPGAPVPTVTNGMAIAALVLGIVYLCGVGSLLAVILGLVALSQIKKRQQGGRGMAIAGLVLGIVGILATIGLLLIPVITATATSNLEETAQANACETEERQIRTAVEAYRADVGPSTATPTLDDLVADYLLQETPVDHSLSYDGTVPVVTGINDCA